MIPWGDNKNTVMDYSEGLTIGSHLHPHPRAQFMALFSSNPESELNLPNHVIVFLQLNFLEVTTKNSKKTGVDFIWPGLARQGLIDRRVWNICLWRRSVKLRIRGQTITCQCGCRGWKRVHETQRWDIHFNMRSPVKRKGLSKKEGNGKGLKGLRRLGSLLLVRVPHCLEVSEACMEELKTIFCDTWCCYFSFQGHVQTCFQVTKFLLTQK